MKLRTQPSILGDGAIMRAGDQRLGFPRHALNESKIESIDHAE
jgi:hypothetical protein